LALKIKAKDLVQTKAKAKDLLFITKAKAKDFRILVKAKAKALHGVLKDISRPRPRTNIPGLNREDAMDRGRWKKLMKIG